MDNVSDRKGNNGASNRAFQDQSWFEMRDVRRRRLDGAAWVPLRERQYPVREGKHGTTGFQEEVVLKGSIAVPIAQRALAEELDWHDVDLRDHRSFADEDSYTPADVHRETSGPAAGLEAVRLVIQQASNRAEKDEWHLHQDLVVALELLREGDTWVAQNEGYEPVVRLKRDATGRAILIEMRSEFLKDYLAARRMALYVSSYRQRAEVCESRRHIDWTEDKRETDALDRWEGNVREIHEGGMPFGAKTAVFHASRTDVDPEEDVPVMGPPADNNIKSESWTAEDTRPKLYRIQGAFWRREWVEPGASSPRVRGDDVPNSVSFIVDASGRRLSARELANEDDYSGEGRWLWFRPEVVPALINRRGGSLEWYTRDTGCVRCSPDHDVHFGMNEIGWVTVYAKDVAQLPEWQRQLWAGFNVAPDGRVSRELLASQVEADPAKTYAAEQLIPEILHDLDRVAVARLGSSILHPHVRQPEHFECIHRFRACDRRGLFELAKDVARVTADGIDAKAIQRFVTPPKGEKWGGLKSLEKLLATTAGPDRARAMMGPLVGVYELRLADAHPEGSGVEDALKLARVDADQAPVLQGRGLLESTADALIAIVRELVPPPRKKGGSTSGT